MLLSAKKLCQLIIKSKVLFQPVLLFAGEHTHSNFYSTVHGAYLSGRTAAQILLETESGTETIMECPDESDLSSWIQGIALE